MTERPIYAIELNLDIIKRFREAVHRQERLSIQKCFSGSSGKYKRSPAWDFMCAAMDRIEDTANYLNGLELGRKANNTALYHHSLENQSHVNEGIPNESAYRLGFRYYSD